MRPYRRGGPRIPVTTLCWELTEGKETESLAVELSPDGLRIERPYVGGLARRQLALELEVPGVDEVMWVRGEACFDVLIPATSRSAGPFGLLRRTGYRIVGAAQRELRMLREFVIEHDRARHAERTRAEHRALHEARFDLAFASCYARA